MVIVRPCRCCKVSKTLLATKNQISRDDQRSSEFLEVLVAAHSSDRAGDPQPDGVSPVHDPSNVVFLVVRVDEQGIASADAYVYKMPQLGKCAAAAHFQLYCARDSPTHKRLDEHGNGQETQTRGDIKHSFKETTLLNSPL